MFQQFGYFGALIRLEQRLLEVLRIDRRTEIRIDPGHFIGSHHERQQPVLFRRRVEVVEQQFLDLHLLFERLRFGARAAFAQVGQLLGGTRRAEHLLHIFRRIQHFAESGVVGAQRHARLLVDVHHLLGEIGNLLGELRRRQGQLRTVGGASAEQQFAEAAAFLLTLGNIVLAKFLHGRGVLLLALLDGG